MKIKSVTVVAFVVLACYQSLIAQFGPSECVSLASTLREYNVSRSSSGYLNSVFDNYCEQSGEAKTSNTNIGLDTIINGSPVFFDLGVGDNVSKMRTFCRNYRGTRISFASQSSYEERLTDKALETIQSCYRLISQNVLVTHDLPSFRQVTFYLRSSVGTQLEFTGVAAVPSTGVTCSGQIDGNLRTFDKKTNLRVATAQSFVCERNPTVLPDGTSVFEEQVIIVQTKQGNYSVVLPKEQKVAQNLASQILERFNKIDNSILGIQSQYNQLGSGEGCRWLGSKNRYHATGGNWVGQACGNNEYARAIQFIHDAGNDYFYNESFDVQCCPITFAVNSVH